MDLLQKIQERILFCDGGMGSLLQEQGLPPGELPGVWNMTHPEVLVDIHKAYLEAGADIITTNTFGVDSLKYNDKTTYQADEVIRAAVSHVRTAIAASGREAYAALDISSTGKLLKPLGDLDFEDAYQIFKQIVDVGTDAGADLILIETMSDSYEAKAAVLAAKENSDLPVFVTMTFDSKGKLLTGGNAQSTVALLEGLGVDALGINCGLGPVQMKAIATEILSASSVPVIVNPNAGLPRSEGGKTVYDIDSDTFAKVMQEIVASGARVAGGCCGTTPEHIRKTVELCRDLQPVPLTRKNRTVVSSFAQAVVIDKDPVIIGERINPTGKSKFKQALRDHDLEYILREGVSQQDHGADILDVNVGLPEIDEPAMMEEVVKELQSIIDLPLQIDTSDIGAMERAMRIYNGKPMINSVNGKQESMEAVFPLVKKYGGVVVALALDESGIPETAEGRIQIARKIYQTAAEYGIGAEDIVIDALCLTVSSDSQGAITTLETLRRVRDELHGKTVLGVSNISFGLPQREIINAAFFTMAMQCGLSAAIINPNSEAMMRAYYSYRALMDLDAQCEDYIRIYSGQTVTLGTSAGKGQSQAQSNAAGAADMSLRESIGRGLKERAVAAVKEQLLQKDPLEVIQSEMIPALDEVGKGFEAGSVFLPQLLMSAEAAKAAFEIIKDQMQAMGQAQEKKGTVILATVKGDIHDIGKNIVKVLLENYSFDVMDLGKDVPPELVVDTAVKHQVSLVGLSALMTTTVPNMEETIKQLREHAPWVKVMVGGAVLTEEYARTIDADRYCRDAMASVNYAQEILTD
ncbi:MAG: homocysteine S-methyltransferase family protein [Lachnospiraceae bacterium]